jgi:hypothetical protein
MEPAPVDSETLTRSRTMLKKAGIVVATAAAGLLAMSPLAFAGDDYDRDHHHDWDRDRDRGSSQGIEVEGNIFQRDNFELEDNVFCNFEGEFGLVDPLGPGPQNIQCSEVEIEEDAVVVPPVIPPVIPVG